MNKTALKNFAVMARTKLIESVSQRAYEYDIHEDVAPDPNVTELNDTALSAEEIRARRAVCERIVAVGFSAVMEEAAYTWFNRFIALRFMEVNDYLDTHIRVFSNASGAFKPEILREAMHVDLPGLDRNYILELINTQQDEELYKYLLINQCNYLHDHGLNQIFEEFGSWTELLFPKFLLREDGVIAAMINDIPEEDWREQVQIIGWLYQYYNTEPKEAVFAGLKKNVKITAQTIPAATQLFTPDWIVRYMVENSLGRLWTLGHEKPGNADWRYYLNEAEQEPEVAEKLEQERLDARKIKPQDILLIDPAMGSAHILVYAYDVLMDIYLSRGWTPQMAAKTIITQNLYGLDIDKRAYQLGYFSLMMKAWKDLEDPVNSQPHLANFADAAYYKDLSKLKGDVRAFAEQFRSADTYGSLMTVKPPKDEAAVREAAKNSPDFLELALNQMLMISEILNKRYDVVCSNPPYMGSSGMGAKLSEFVKTYFPSAKSDLFACFMVKAYSLAKSQGYTALITMESWMFLSSFETLRSDINKTKTFINMVHMPYLGKGGTSLGINFGTAAVVTYNSRIPNYKAQYEYTVYYETDKEGVPFVFPTINERWCAAKQENFQKIPGAPVAYWVSENFVKAFENPKLGDKAATKVGLQTGDNDRFLRLWYEVRFGGIEFNATDRNSALASSKKWFPHNKGGDFRKWYGNNDYVVNWEYDGIEIKHCFDGRGKLRSRPQNTEYYFRECFSWSLITSGSISFRYKPIGHIPNALGISCYSDNNMYYLLALCNTKYALKVLNIVAPTLANTPGDIAKLPVKIDPAQKPRVEALVRENIELSRADWDSFETSWDFKKHPLL